MMINAKAVKNVFHIHGAWHGAWAFDKLKPDLRYNATFIDYPSLIQETGIAFPNAFSILAQCVRCNIEHINRVFGANSKVTIVAHSAGGPLGTLTADALGNRVEKLVLIDAYIIPNGQSLIEVASGDVNSTLLPAIHLNTIPGTPYPDGSYYVDPANVTDIFYNKCSKADVAYATSRLNNREVFPVMEPVVYTSNVLSNISKYYISGINDNAITYGFQELMLDSSPFGNFSRLTLSGDHSPFFSRKSLLALFLNLIVSF